LRAYLHKALGLALLRQSNDVEALENYEKFRGPEP